MIEIRSLNEIASLHQSGMVPFRIMQEVAFVLLGLTDNDKDIAAPTAITQQEVDWLLAQSEDIDFMTYMGGNVFIVETNADLAEVVGMDFEFAKLHGRWPNCMEAILPLDEIKYLIKSDGSADYVLLFAATNNAGGSSWFIPRHLWQAAKIDKQIEAHQQFWNVAA